MNENLILKKLIFLKNIQSHIERLQEYLVSYILRSKKVKIRYVEY